MMLNGKQCNPNNFLMTPLCTKRRKRKREKKKKTRRKEKRSKRESKSKRIK